MSQWPCLLRCEKSNQAHVGFPVEVGAAPRGHESGGYLVFGIIFELNFHKHFYLDFLNKWGPLKSTPFKSLKNRWQGHLLPALVERMQRRCMMRTTPRIVTKQLEAKVDTILAKEKGALNLILVGPHLEVAQSEVCNHVARNCGHVATG